MNKFAIAYTSRCNRPQTPEIFNIKSLKKAPMCISISLHAGLRSDGYEKIFKRGFIYRFSTTYC